jgi:hypothetical protein
MRRIIAVIVGIWLGLPGCASLMHAPKQDIVLLIDPETLNYKCFQTNKDVITCRRISE